MHECLLRLYEDVEVDPVVAGYRTPDFAVSERDGRRIYIEVTVVTEESDVERGRRRVRGQFYDYLNTLDIPDYFLWIREMHIPPGVVPSGRRFSRWLQAWVKDLDYEVVLATAVGDRVELLPRRTFEDGGCRIDVALIPVKREHRGAPGHRPVGIHAGATRWGTSSPAISAKLMDKGTRYPALDGPLVVFVNINSPWASGSSDVYASLFGPRYEEGISDRSPEDGAVWCSRGGPSYTRISAVLFGSVFVSNLGQARIELVSNPWAQPLYDNGQLTRFGHTTVEDGRLATSDGIPLHQLLELTTGWPGGLFDP
jgi:hypothetical protein